MIDIKRRRWIKTSAFEAILPETNRSLGEKINYKEIRERCRLTCDQMAAMLRLEGQRRANKVREFECGTREPSGPIRLIYETLHRQYEPDFWWEPVQ